MIIDGHVTIGQNREVALDLEQLLATMDRFGIDRALVAPPERMIPVHNREGNELTIAVAQRSDNRVLAYAVATPWLGREAIDVLARARDAGARALRLDPPLQGFDLLDGLADPLLEFAVESDWPVYVRTGTPPHALPLQLAALAARFPAASFIMGRSGATDFGQDGPAALEVAPNLYADSAHISWPVALATREGYAARVVFTSDAPFADMEIEFARVADAPLGDRVRKAILGQTLASLLGLDAQS
jgi:predicted TIM-barrel fold metal-dependent hydrolase